MNIFSLCGISLIAYAALQILGKDKNGLGALIGLGGILCLLAPAFLSLAGLMREVNQFIENYEFYGTDLLFRGLGLGFCCEVTGDILRDAGNNSLANALDISCKIAILALCLPLWKNIFALVEGLIT